MEWLWSADYAVARLLIGRGIAVIYLIGFVCAARQFPALLGERGLEPAPEFVRRVPFRRAPSLFHLGYSDRGLVALSWLGVLVSLTLVVGLAEALPLPLTMAAWLFLWIAYLSIVNVGQDFYSFGWESLLLEAGFLATFLGNDATPPPFPVILLFRWLAFRLEFGAGLIKLRGDPCWRDLTCMDYHHETQPMPNPLSWLFHRLPRPLHRVEVLGNFAAQLVMPFGLFLPQPFASVAAAVMIVTQGYLVVSGNYAWLNWLTIVIAISGLSDSVVRTVVGALLPVGASSFGPAPAWFAVAVVALAALVVALSYWPARNLLSRRQLMNAPFNPLHLVNTYGAFGSVTRQRNEVVVEGTDDATLGPDTTWREYEFKGKPTALDRLPPQVAPYHLRLDWLMWFAALTPAYAEGWFVPFLVRLLHNDAPTLRLLAANPFPDRPPSHVRARLYRYRFSSRAVRRRSGAWWTRSLVGEYLPAIHLVDGEPRIAVPGPAGARGGPRRRAETMGEARA